MPVLLLLYIPCRLLSTDLSRPPKHELILQSRCDAFPDIPVAWIRWECIYAKPGPDPGGPPGPRTAPRKQGGHRDRKPTKSTKTSQKHPEKHPKAPERPQSGGTGVPPAPPERERESRNRERTKLCSPSLLATRCLLH